MDYGNLKVPENVTPEVQTILDSYANRNKEIEKAHRKNMGRIGAGALLELASLHPILNIPYVGTGLGGALFESGNAIMEGKKAKDIAKDAGIGFAVGESVGAIPYVGKYASKTKAGQAVANKVAPTVESLLNTPIAKKVEDALMTDIKAFNPFKQTQTAYHGSPYDFNKFSNEAIGTGEGAQAHGYGHYSALDKEVGEEYRARLTKNKYNEDVLNKPELSLLTNMRKDDLRTYGKDYVVEELKKDIEYTSNWLDDMKKAGRLTPEMKQRNINTLNKQKAQLEVLENFDESLYEPNKGQLYKLSIPKDDVMLREDLPINQQPKAVQDAINKINQKLGFGNYDDLSKQSLDVSNQIKNQYNFQNIDWQKVRELESLQDEITKKMTAVNPNIIGKNYYKSIGKNSNLLNQHGIKGISYNGGIDGEARVIFNPDDIDIVRKYYNQPSLGEMLLKKSPNAGATSNYLYNLMIRE